MQSCWAAWSPAPLPALPQRRRGPDDTIRNELGICTFVGHARWFAEIGEERVQHTCHGCRKLLPLPIGLARGVRAASDFLMALQLTGAAKADSIANMQVRLPVVVIGGGLTAIDTATESLAYYVVQVEKFLTEAK